MDGKVCLPRVSIDWKLCIICQVIMFSICFAFNQFITHNITKILSVYRFFRNVEKVIYSTLKVIYSTLKVIYSTLKVIYNTLKVIYSNLKVIYSTLKVIYSTFFVVLNFSVQFLKIPAPTPFKKLHSR